jgi:hypothetical protein
MKSLLTYLFITLSTYFAIIAQDSTFNYIYTSEYPTPDFSDIIVHNDTIVGVGTAKYELSGGYQTGIIIARFDSMGQQIDTKLIEEPNGHLYGLPFQYGRITKITKGGYLLTAAIANNMGGAGTAIKLDDQLEIEWSHNYTSPDLPAGVEFQDPVELEDGYLLYGASPRANFVASPVVYRINKAGEVIWFNYYGNPNVQEYYWGELVLLDNNTFAVGGTGDDGTFIHIIDLDGNFINSWYPGYNSEIGSLRRMQVTADGSYIIMAQRIIEEVDSPTKAQPVLSRISPDFEIEWSYPFGELDYLNTNARLWDIQPTPDGNFIGAGTARKYGPSYNRKAGWLFKFRPNGDSLWTHLIDPVPADSLDITWAIYGGVGVLSSGSYIAGGEAALSTTYMWLTKVTADGCLEDFCPEINVISSTNPLPTEREIIKVYPNPANDQLHIEATSAYQSGTFRLFNLNGQQQLILELPETAKTSINVQQFPAGLYFYELRSASGEQVQGRVLIQY